MARDTTKRITAGNRFTTGRHANKPGGLSKRPDEARGEAAPWISQEQIAVRAYEIYVSRGAANGKELEDWLQAERELAGRS
jgi:hypothetical protein